MKNLCLKGFLIASVFTSSFFVSCDNDDSNAPNENACNFEGFSIELNNNTIVTYPESTLLAEYFPNNDGIGEPGIEIWDTSNPGSTFITTNVFSVGDVDNNPEIRINDIDYQGVVTCQRIDGVAIGDNIRYDIVINGLGEAEFCGDIDTVNP